jgi:hypothetical protein
MFSFKKHDEEFVERALNPTYRSVILPKLEHNRTLLLMTTIVLALVHLSNIYWPSSPRSADLGVLALLSMSMAWLEINRQIKLYKLIEKAGLKTETVSIRTHEQFEDEVATREFWGIVVMILAFFVIIWSLLFL